MEKETKTKKPAAKTAAKKTAAKAADKRPAAKVAEKKSSSKSVEKKPAKEFFYRKEAAHSRAVQEEGSIAPPSGHLVDAFSMYRKTKAARPPQASGVTRLPPHVPAKPPVPAAPALEAAPPAPAELP
ncbi:MAG: hypothetical protein AAB576_09000, partial [Elusimicrobiota bacterium]